MTPRQAGPSESSVVRANRARRRALNRLVAAHQDEFDAYYDEEAAAEGVQTRRRAARQRLADLEAEAARLRREYRLPDG